MRAFTVFITAVSVMVIVSGILVLSMHAEMLLLYGPQAARQIAWLAEIGIACAIVAPFGVRRLGRRS
jgi:type II secretory pathway component PulK